MKIKRARIYLAEVCGRRPILLELATDEGIRGVGEAALMYGAGATAAAGMIKDLVSMFLLGKDPFRIEALWNEMYDHTFWAKGGGPVVFAGMSAVEHALWDIKGKALGVPVYELLGGRVRDDVWVYANAWSYQCNKPDEFARAAEKVVSDGFTALKMYPLAMPSGAGKNATLRHVTHRTLDRDHEELAVERVRAVRQAVGPKVNLMVDMSAELTTDGIIRIGSRLEEFDIFFLEEPVDPFDVEALKKVSDHVRIPIAVGERLYTRSGFRRVMELQAADILQPDVGTSGGILETRKIAAMAETYGMRVAPHNCASPVCTAVSLQLVACIPNFLILETFPYRSPEHFALADRAPELEIRAGRLPIPDRPGLGISLAQDRVKPFLWTELEK